MITPDTRPLTALEAAMLGLWLMGFVCVLKDMGGLWVNSRDDGMYPEYREWLQPNNYAVYDDMGLPECRMILPWLTAHGITPPEVEGIA